MKRGLIVMAATLLGLEQTGPGPVAVILRPPAGPSVTRNLSRGPRPPAEAPAPALPAARPR